MITLRVRIWYVDPEKKDGFLADRAHPTFRDAMNNSNPERGRNVHHFGALISDGRRGFWCTFAMTSVQLLSHEYALSFALDQVKHTYRHLLGDLTAELVALEENA